MRRAPRPRARERVRLGRCVHEDIWRTPARLPGTSVHRSTTSGPFGRVVRRTMPVGARCFAVLLVLHPALGAFPSSLPIDLASLDALLAGQDVCGDADHRESCLRVADCAKMDPLVECTAADPVWLPDPARGGGGGLEVLFRRVLPVPAIPPPNSLKESRNRVVSSAVHQQLPSAVALYDKSAVVKVHAEHCTTRYCVIPAALYLVHEAGVSYPSSKIKVRPWRQP